MKRLKDWSIQKISTGWERLRPRPHMSPKEQRLRKLAIAILGIVLGFCALVFLYVFFIFITLPSLSKLEGNLTQSTLIMDREGNVLYAIHGEENREALDSLEEVSPWLVQATIAIEDDRFYKHIGIDIPAIIKAVLSEIGIGSPRGGSTITQQFVKNTFLSPEQTYKRKLQEIMLALKVELRFKKDEILLLYLNKIPYGNNAYGVETAADRYFRKDAKDLTLAEAALLASLPKAPSRYSPYGDNLYTNIHFELTEETLGSRIIKGEADLSYGEFTRGLIGKTFELPNGDSFYIKGRSDLVLERMEELGYITEDEKLSALAEIQTIAFTPYQETILAPHFVLWVKQMLEEKYGAAVVEQGGLKVYTTLDPDYQKAAEDAIAARWESNNSNYGTNNAAMISVQPSTGQILAMVGSANFFDSEEKKVVDGQVNMITSPRQPGSSFKPFVYSLAFQNGYSPATVLYDVPISFGGDRPDNYDGSFVGPITIRRALGQSRNIPAIEGYFMAGQEEKIVPYVQDLGLTGVRSDGNYGWPLALGTAEVTPLEMAEAYSVFANTGVRVSPTPILKIENADGEVMEQWEEQNVTRKEVMDPQVAYLINDILSDGSVGLGPNVRIDSLDNAAKTGTSNKKMPNGSILPNNNWIAAYTPNLVTITWTGNTNGSAMKGNADGYTTAAPIWKAFMMDLLEQDRLELTQWPRPAGIQEVAISRASGKLPGDNTPSDMIGTELFADFAVPTERDNSFVTLKIETISNRLATEYSPEEFVTEKSFRIHRIPMADVWPHWQEAVNAWAKEHDQGQPPTEYASDIHNALTSQNLPEVVITSPLSLSAVSLDERFLTVEVDIKARGNGVKEVRYSLNGNPQSIEGAAPYSGIVRIPITAGEGDIFEITAKIVDVYGYSSSSSVQIRIGEGSPSKDALKDQEEKPTEDVEEAKPEFLLEDLFDFTPTI